MRTTRGYSSIKIDGRAKHAHVVSFTLANGPPDGIVCHSCNNKICVRPSHIYDGNVLSNYLDAVVAGTAALGPNRSAAVIEATNRARARGDQHYLRKNPELVAGARNPAAKMTEEKVREIRRRFAGGESKNALSKAFGIERAQIRRIVNGECWVRTSPVFPAAGI